MMKIFALFFVLILMLMPLGAAFEASPMNPCPGETVAITGFADPGEAVRLSSSFEMDLPVENGRFEYLAENVEIPRKPNNFAVTARNVESLRVGVKMGIWLTMPVPASGGTASISRSDVPSGRYALKIFGDAQEGASVVPVQVKAETTVYAGPDGRYQLSVDTTGVPVGDYRIRGAGDVLVLSIGGSVPKAVSYDAKNEEPEEEETPPGHRAPSAVGPVYAEEVEVSEEEPLPEDRALDLADPISAEDASVSEEVASSGYPVQNASEYLPTEPVEERSFIRKIFDQILGILGLAK